MGGAEPGVNRTAILEFHVDDVGAEFVRFKNEVKVVVEPKTTPSGTERRSFGIRKPTS